MLIHVNTVPFDLPDECPVCKDDIEWAFETEVSGKSSWMGTHKHSDIAVHFGCIWLMQMEPTGQETLELAMLVTHQDDEVFRWWADYHFPYPWSVPVPWSNTPCG